MGLALVIGATGVRDARAGVAHAAPPTFRGSSPLKAQRYFSGTKLEIAKAIKAGDMARVRLLADGVDLSAPGKKNMTLLWFAMDPAEPSYEGVKTLVSLGVNPMEQIAEGIGSAFYYTLIPREGGRTDSGEKLLEAMLEGGMSPNRVKPGGIIPLMEAVVGPNTLPHVKLLVKHGADVNVRNSIGQNPFSDAISSHEPEIAIYLVTAGSDISSPDRLGITPAWGLKRILDRLPPGVLGEYGELRDLMVSRGVKWPPDPPDVVREQIRARGEEPIVPAGQER